jgi:hypothetical protein
MLKDDLVIAEIRYQSIRLQDVLKSLEVDDKWKENFLYYAKEMQAVERALKRIRSRNLELVSLF